MAPKTQPRVLELSGSPGARERRSIARIEPFRERRDRPRIERGKAVKSNRLDAMPVSHVSPRRRGRDAEAAKPRKSLRLIGTRVSFEGE